MCAVFALTGIRPTKIPGLDIFFGDKYLADKLSDYDSSGSFSSMKDAYVKQPPCSHRSLKHGFFDAFLSSFRNSSGLVDKGLFEKRQAESPDP
jgi:hypothetical protein